MTRRTHKRAVTPAHKKTTREAHETRDMQNRKPYRTKALKVQARAEAGLCEDGTYRSNVMTLIHEKPKRAF